VTDSFRTCTYSAVLPFWPGPRRKQYDNGTSSRITSVKKQSKPKPTSPSTSPSQPTDRAAPKHLSKISLPTRTRNSRGFSAQIIYGQNNGRPGSFRIQGVRAALPRELLTNKDKPLARSCLWLFPATTLTQKVAPAMLALAAKKNGTRRVPVWNL
jgi:hypothetical protein